MTSRVRGIRNVELAAACTLAGTSFAECSAMFDSHPDLFVGFFEGNRLVGACYGWPVLHDRERIEFMRLEVIAIAPDLRGRGLGRALLAAWEERVAARGSWIIDVGSAADGFFLQCGYNPVEYCLKMDNRTNWVLPAGAAGMVSHLTHGEGQVVAYISIAEAYDAAVKLDLARSLGAVEAITIFRKRIVAQRHG